MILKQSISLTTILCLLVTLSMAQNPWKFTEESQLEKKETNRYIIPQKYLTVSADLYELGNILAAAPLRFTEDAKKEVTSIELPMPDGTFQRFAILNAPLMHPKLAAQYPEIQTYSGYGIDDPTAHIRLDLSPQGFHGMILSGKHSGVFIEPYAQFDLQDYIVYYKKDNHAKENFVCHFDEIEQENNITRADRDAAKAFAGDCILRTYRLAVACTGEYTDFHGGTVALALAAVNTTMNRVNGIFENDISVTMTLVPNETDIIYLDGTTDPFTNGTPGTMINENQTVCDDVIGTANYDIGHVFGTDSGGLAQLQSPCGGGKARGVTGSGAPIGDPFDVDYVAHEMGHQYGGNHTQNNSCNNTAVSMEPGSASTIMGYAGICPPNIQNNSDAYFHAISIQEMTSFITSFFGNSCAAQTNTGNTPPTADAGSNHVIPGQTPFVLTAAPSTDNNPNGPANLTYCWEQMDAPQAPMPPQPTNTVGPAFRSLFATPEPYRYFPNLPAIIAGTTPTWEVLSSVDRDYNFRLTVRDNYAGNGGPGSGCTGEDDMSVEVDGDSGPFVVLVPNTAGECWSAFSQQTVTWDVANTNQAPVNTPNVDILLSTDGGLTYPTVLASNVPNNGSYTVDVPDMQTTTARIMIIGNGNIFFDISDEDFEIKAASGAFFINANPSNQTICSGDNAIYDIDLGLTASTSNDVTLSVNGNPAGTTANFTNTTLAVPGSTQLTIGNTASAAVNTYTLTITGTDGTSTISQDVTLTIVSGNPSTTLNNPANGATNTNTSPTFDWSTVANAISYELELATDSGFSNIIDNPTGLTNNSYTTNLALDINTIYYWRVKTVNACGEVYSSTYSFTTDNIVCISFNSTDTPVNIIDNTTVTSTLNIPNQGTITDIDVYLDISHTWVGDLIINISHDGTTVNLLDNVGNPAISGDGCGNDNIDATLDDDSTVAVEDECNSGPAISGTVNPEGSLSDFNGLDLNGDWILSFEDTFGQDSGTVNAYTLNICYTPPPSVNCPPVINVPDEPIPNSLYQAGVTVISDGVVANGSNVTFDAGQCIELNETFEVEPGAVFEAIIGGCATLTTDTEEDK